MAEMRSLENLWPEARSVDIGNQLTDGRLVSLGRIHLSIHSLIVYARPEGWRNVYASSRQSVYLESLSDEACFLLLALEQWSEQFRHDPAAVTRIQSDAAGRMGNQGPGTDGYWAALSVLVESLCMERIEPFLV